MANQIGDLKVGIGVEVNLQELNKGGDSLRKFATEAKRVGDETQKNMRQADNAIEAIGVTSEKTEKKNTRAVNAMARNMERFTAKTKADYFDFIAAQAGIEKQTEDLRKTFRKQEEDASALAIATKKAADQQREFARAQKEYMDLQSAAAIKKETERQREFARAQREYITAQEQATKEKKDFIRALEDEVRTSQMTRKEMLEYRAAQLGVLQESQPHINAMFDTSKAYKSVEMSAKQTRQAMRLLPAQITDVVTSLASGMPIYLVAIQQGGQLRDSFGGFGNVLKGIRSLISPTMLAFGGLAASIGAVYLISEKLSAASREINKSLIQTGNSAGVTSEKLVQMSESIAKGFGTQQGAAQAIANLVAQNKIAVDSYAEVAEASVAWSLATGKSVEDVISEFEKIAEKPQESLVELSKTYNFLSNETYKYIQDLINQNKEVEASEILIRKLSDTLLERTPAMIEQVNIFKRAWMSVTGAIDEVGVKINQVFGTSVENKISSIKSKIEELTNATDPESIAVAPILISNLQTELAYLETQTDAYVKNMAEQAEANRATAETEQYLKDRRTERQIADAKAAVETQKYLKLLGQGLPLQEANLELTQAYVRAMQEIYSPLDKNNQESKKSVGIINDVNAEIRKSIENYAFETDAMLMNSYERERAAFIREMETKGIQENSVAWRENMDAFMQAQLVRQSAESQLEYVKREKKAAEDAMKERLKAEEEFAKEVDRINNQIGQSLTDALVEGGMNAKEFLITMFKTLILRPLIQPIISGVLGAVGIGTAGAAFAGQGVDASLGQATGLVGLVSTLKGTLDAVTGGFAALGASVSELALEGGFQLISAGAYEAGGALINAAGTIGVAAEILGGVAAGIGIGQFISGGYSVAGSSLVSTGIGTAAGAIIGSIVPGIGTAIGAAVGGAIGGAVNRLFGMGQTYTERTGIQGTLTAGGLGADFVSFQEMKQKGGLFRGDKVWAEYAKLEGEAFDVLDANAKAVGASVRTMAEALGLNADVIQGITRGITIDTKGLSDEEISKRIGAEFKALADTMANAIDPMLSWLARAGESASDVLARLSTSLSTVNTTFDVLGFSLYDVSIKGAQAADNLINMFGGIEGFTAATSFYYENFYSEQERANKQLEQMTDLFSVMGLRLPDTNAQFRAMAESAEAAGDTTLLASLLQLAPAFHSLTSAMAQANAQIVQQRNQLVGQIYQILGDTASIRAQEISELDESNRSLQEYIYAIEDAAAAQQAADRAVAEATAQLSDAVAAEIANIEEQINQNLTDALGSLEAQFEQLTQQINSQIATLQAQRQVANEALNNIRSIFDFLSDQIDDIFGLIRPVQTAAEGALFVTRALEAAQRTGYLPDPDQLRSAVSAARSGLGAESFISAFEMRRANLQFANELIQLQEIAAGQAVDAENQVNAADEQVELLRRRLEQAQQQYDQNVTSTRLFYDAQLNAERSQLNALLNIDDNIVSVQAGLNGLAVALDKQTSANKALIKAQQEAAEAAAKTKEQPFEMTPFQKDINKIYQNVLGREADIPGLEFYSSSGKSLAQIEAEIYGSPEYRRIQIEQMYRDIFNREADAAGLTYWMATGLSLDAVKSELLKAKSLGAYADGGFAPPGLALVGEKGPELVNFARPAMVYTAGETAEIMNGGAKSVETASEIRQLRQENQAQSRALVSLQARMTRLLERWDGDGIPEERAVTA